MVGGMTFCNAIGFVLASLWGRQPCKRTQIHCLAADETLYKIAGKLKNARIVCDRAV